MCGIAGIFNPERHEINWDHVFDLWDGISDRGKMASGMAWVYGPEDDLKVKIMKSPRTPKQMEDFMGKMARKDKRPRIIIMHTRYATQGSIKDNRNNHPVTVENIILTHNGVIYNDDEVFNQLGVKRAYDVDTEAIATGLEMKGIDWVAEWVWGSMSLAWLDRDNLGQLNLFTNGENPLVFSRLEDQPSILVYASCSWHLDESKFDLHQTLFAMPYTYYYTQEGQLFKRNITTYDTMVDGVPAPQQPYRFGKKRSIY